MRSQDRFRGCLLGGAAGDALGYPIEFIGETQIFRRYGPGGITAYDLQDGIALISDDTQMTLFTANGLLLARASGASYSDAMWHCCQDWLRTQETKYSPAIRPRYAWLGNIPELYSPRAPGNTCLSALRTDQTRSVQMPVNNSKGCGGVMRVAPIGLYFNDRDVSIEEICRLGAEASAITHGHLLGWMPAAAFVQIIHEVAEDDASIQDAVRHAMDQVCSMWPESPERSDFMQLMQDAVTLAGQREDDLDAIHMLGGGWVAEEALAIAVYCALKYAGDFDRALIASVNHSGDSDSTGAITGNILGAQVGLTGIPKKYREHLELSGLVLEVADDLWRDAGEDDPVWQSKYKAITYGR